MIGRDHPGLTAHRLGLGLGVHVDVETVNAKIKIRTGNGNGIVLRRAGPRRYRWHRRHRRQHLRRALRTGIYRTVSVPLVSRLVGRLGDCLLCLGRRALRRGLPARLRIGRALRCGRRSRLGRRRFRLLLRGSLNRLAATRTDQGSLKVTLTGYAVIHGKRRSSLGRNAVIRVNERVESRPP